MATQTMPMWATKEQGNQILNILEDLKVIPITVEARAYDPDVEGESEIEVKGQIVYLYEGMDDKGYLIQASPYEGQPVTFMVRKGMHYFIKISSKLAKHYSPTTASGVADNPTTVVLRYSDIRNVDTFAAIQAVLDNINDMYETNAERVAAARVALVDTENPIEIADIWKDDGDNPIEDPMVVVDVKTWETIDGEIKVGAKLQRKYATLKTIQFDAPEQEVATEEFAEQGVYYIGKNSENALSKLNLKTGDAVPYDSYVTIYRNKYNDTSIVTSGHNRYEYSAWRQYLNSSAPLGEWWHRMHAGQMPPAGADTRGYMAGCSEALLAAIKRVKITNYAASLDGNDVYGLFDYFHLSSGTEFNGAVNTNEGTVDKYWIDRMGGLVESNAAIAGRIIRKVTNKTGGGVNVWSRSANRSSSNGVWLVDVTGQLSVSGIASYQYAGCPACVIF